MKENGSEILIKQKEKQGKKESLVKALCHLSILATINAEITPTAMGAKTFLDQNFFVSS